MTWQPNAVENLNSWCHPIDSGDTVLWCSQQSRRFLVLHLSFASDGVFLSVTSLMYVASHSNVTSRESEHTPLRQIFSPL